MSETAVITCANPACGAFVTMVCDCCVYPIGSCDAHKTDAYKKHRECAKSLGTWRWLDKPAPPAAPLAVALFTSLSPEQQRNALRLGARAVRSLLRAVVGSVNRIADQPLEDVPTPKAPK